MTPQDKELLFRDLSARLPYGVVCRFEINGHQTPFFDADLQFCEAQPNGTRFVGLTKGHRFNVSKVKPFLRPMSSMTEDEMNEFDKIKLSYHFDEDGYVLFDWLRSKHFNINLPDGLYIEVNDSNNPYK